MSRNVRGMRRDRNEREEMGEGKKEKEKEEDKEKVVERDLRRREMLPNGDILAGYYCLLGRKEEEHGEEVEEEQVYV